MYKTRLQELCHKRKWAVPTYTAVKCGPDHQSRFGASVFVNDASFDSPVDFNSLKQAHNHVARLALFHFTSPTFGLNHSAIGQMTEETYPNLDVCSNEKPDNEDRSVMILPDDTNLVSGDNGFESQYKNQLQEYAKQRNLDSPSYSIESDGSRASLFKATVRVSESVFESTKSFKTSIEAENSVAKNALTSLLIDNFHKDEVRSYKSLLQELSHREGFCAPVYRTTNFGEARNRMFSSTVEIEGEIFYGKSAYSKKLSEIDSARVAYLALQERIASRMLAEYSKSTRSDPSAEDDHNLQSSLAHESLENYGLNSSSIGKFNLPSYSASNSSAKRDATYLLNNKVRVYRKFPNRPFPEGITILPIDDNKWTAVSLEFPK